MEKLPMCRICLVANVRILVVNKNLHEVYEKLTDIPFVTEDRRPMLACFFCCAKLKQCYRLMRQCLDAEKLFAQMMNEDYELNPLINQDHIQLFSGFTKSPTENISIVDVVQTENIAVKELPAVCERLDDVIQPKEEHQSDELELENFENSVLDVADIRPHHSESDLEQDVPLMVFKTEVEVEQAVYKNKRRAREMTSTLVICTFSRMHLFEIWSAVTGSVPQKHQHVLETILASLDELESLDIRNLDSKILDLCKSLDRFWKIVSRDKSKLLLKYSKWLDEIECVELVRSNEQCIQENANQPGPSCERGRPRKDFSELSKRAKRNIEKNRQNKQKGRIRGG